ATGVFVLDASGRGYQSRDGARFQPLPLDPSLVIGAIWISPDDIVYLAGDRIVRSVDLGATWSDLTASPLRIDALHRMSGTSKSDLYIVGRGRDSSIYHSD